MQGKGSKGANLRVGDLPSPSRQAYKLSTCGLESKVAGERCLLLALGVNLLYSQGGMVAALVASLTKVHQRTGCTWGCMGLITKVRCIALGEIFQKVAGVPCCTI